MNIKAVGASAAKLNQGIESLARTDDILAVIGIIMLFGLIASSYGEFWQGKLARAQYEEECGCEAPTKTDMSAAKRKYNLIITTVVIIVLTLMLFIFRKQISRFIKGKAA